jgi:plastocyanin
MKNTPTNQFAERTAAECARPRAQQAWNYQSQPYFPEPVCSRALLRPGTGALWPFSLSRRLNSSLSPRARLFQWVFAGLATCALSFSPPTLASNVANVNIGDFFFSPAAVTIKVNDQVKWTWIGSIGHTSTSDTGLWDSGVKGNGATFVRTFTAAGSFPYHCTVHPFMMGALTVQAANVPPTIAITNPPNGSVLASPATFSIAAKPSDTDGSVTNVLFLEGTTSLGNVQNSPYLVTVHNLAAGDYTFAAEASDNGGAKATNAITIHIVAPAAITLSGVQRLSPASFQFTYSATAGLRYVIQRSGDLTRWTALTTNNAKSGSEVFLDQNATGNPGFYRVGLLPNP